MIDAQTTPIHCQAAGASLIRLLGGTGQGTGATHWYIYARPADGQPIPHCPGCGIVLDLETTSETALQEEKRAG